MKKKISEKEYQQLENKIWDAFLEKASPEETYHALLTANFDSNSYLLQYIKDKPNTDQAIVLAAYWMSEPYYFKQFLNREDCLQKQSWAVESFDYVEELEKKYCNGFYTENTMGCDPKNIEINQETDWTARRDDMEIIREIPQKMFLPLQGKAIAPPDYYAYTEGLPNAYYEEVELIFEKYEIVY